MPPKPDFDKLFGGNAESQPVAITHTGFDLPGVPEDFDPNAEMLAPEYDYNTATDTAAEDDPFAPMDEDAHSPFNADDPFALAEEDKKD